MSKCVGNTACILAYLFNSVSRQNCEVWASQSPFLHSFNETVPPSGYAFVGALTGLWHRVTNDLHLNCPILQLL